MTAFLPEGTACDRIDNKENIHIKEQEKGGSTFEKILGMRVRSLPL